MSFAMLDIAQQAGMAVFGNTAFLAFAIIGVLLVILFFTRMPIYFGLLLLAPLLIGFADIGFIPGIVKGIVILLLGAMLGLFFLKIFTQ